MNETSKNTDVATAESSQTLTGEDPPFFYRNAEKYWSDVDASIKGMLGGLKLVDKPDISGSTDFLDRFGPSNCCRALDCGAGIGRITKRLLLPRFQTVDMVEMTKKFLDQATNFIGPPDISRVGSCFCMPLQDFTPSPGIYDLIWIQWVIGHLTIPATVSFFRRCIAGLREPTSPSDRRSLIVLKDNVSSHSETEFDECDSSYLRSHEEFLSIFKQSGLHVIADELQTNMPCGLYPVRAFALVPEDDLPNS